MSAVEATQAVEAPKRKKATATTKKTTTTKKKIVTAKFKYQYDANDIFEHLVATCDDSNASINRNSNEYKESVSVLEEFGKEFLGMKSPKLYQKVKMWTRQDDYSVHRLFGFVLAEEDFDVKKWADEQQAYWRARGVSFDTSLANSLVYNFPSDNERAPSLYMSNDSHLEEQAKPETWTNMCIRVFKDKYTTFNQYKDDINSVKDMARQNRIISRSSFCQNTEDNVWVITVDQIKPRSSGNTYPSVYLTSIGNWKTGLSDKLDIFQPINGPEREKGYVRVSDRWSNINAGQAYSSNWGSYSSCREIRKQHITNIKDMLKFVEYEQQLSKHTKLVADHNKACKDWVADMLPTDRKFVFVEKIKRKEDITTNSLYRNVFFKPDNNNYWFCLSATGMTECTNRESRLLDLSATEPASNTVWLRLVNGLTKHYINQRRSAVRDSEKLIKKLRDELSAPRFKTKLFQDAGFIVNSSDERNINLEYNFDGYQFMDHYFVPLKVKMTMRWDSVNKSVVPDTWYCKSDSGGGSWHPHISSGKVCTGTFGGPVKEAIRLNNAHELVALLATFLNSYNYSGAFRHIESCLDSNNRALQYIYKDERGLLKTANAREVQEYYHTVYAHNTTFANGSAPSHARPREASQDSSEDE